jgi:hypothetical protein
VQIDLKNIANLIASPNLDSELHMIRHFNYVSENLRNKLTEKDISSSHIDHYLSVPGSRFYTSFASDINQLLVKAFMFDFSHQLGDNGNWLLNFKIPNSEFPSGIGTKTVVNINEISISEHLNIYVEKNRGVPLLHLNVKSLPITNEFVIILKPVSDRFIFISAFPGPPAMPLPIDTMEKNLFESCKTFWDSHVFLVKN